MHPRRRRRVARTSVASEPRSGRKGLRDLDFNVLGIWFRVYFDVGIREQDHRGMLKANGAAA